MYFGNGGIELDAVATVPAGGAKLIRETLHSWAGCLVSCSLGARPSSSHRPE